MHHERSPARPASPAASAAIRQLQRILRDRATPHDLAVSEAHLRQLARPDAAPAQLHLFPPRAG